jgi:hypothetical protein
VLTVTDVPLRLREVPLRVDETGLLGTLGATELARVPEVDRLTLALCELPNGEILGTGIVLDASVFPDVVPRLDWEELLGAVDEGVLGTESEPAIELSVVVGLMTRLDGEEFAVPIPEGTVFEMAAAETPPRFEGLLLEAANDDGVPDACVELILDNVEFGSGDVTFAAENEA